MMWRVVCLVTGGPAAVFEELGCTVEWKQGEGSVIDPGPEGKQLVAIVRGKVGRWKAEPGIWGCVGM